LGMTINQFCEAVPMSRSMFEKLQRQGLAPRTVRLGRAVRISVEAASAWMREREGKRL
jgi:predicted DNA-binding transcriptional regulator AlpA